MPMLGFHMDPDHMARPIARPAPARPEHLARGTVFPDGIDGAKADGYGDVLLDDDSVHAARRRAVRGIGRASTAGIPALDAAGNLPVGVHAATRGEFLTRFGTGSVRREALATQFDSALAALHNAGVEHAVIGGSMVTSKADPGDIDLAWVRRAGVTSHSAVTSAVSAVGDAPDVHVYPADEILADAPRIASARPGENFLEFFQHDRAKVPRGVVLVPTAPTSLPATNAIDAAALLGDDAVSLRGSIAKQAMAGLRALSPL